MTVNGIGDLASAFHLRRQAAEVKGMTQRLASEMATGLLNDPARRLGGDLVPLAGIETSLARLKGFGVAAAEAGIFAGAMQATLATLDRHAGDLAPSLLSAASSGNRTMIANLANSAADRLDAALSALNARIGDRTLFAGVASDGPAVAPAGTLLAALDTMTAGLTTAADIEAAVTAWFADPSGYAATIYQGGAATGPVGVSPEDSVTLSLTAEDPVLRETLLGLSLAALVTRAGGLTLPAEQQRLALRAGERMIEGQSGRSDLAARLGLTEGRIEAAAQRNRTEISALETARAELVSSDPYETAARLQAAESQLEALYTVTTRLARLSLVDFLR